MKQKRPKRRAKTIDPLANLSPRKLRYLKERVNGKSKKDAALAAGYSQSSAKNVAQVVETEDLRKAFRRLMREAASPERIAQTIKAGLKAKQTKFFQREGVVTDSREVIDYGERREYAKLVAQFAGYHSTDDERGLQEFNVQIVNVGGDPEEIAPASYIGKHRISGSEQRMIPKPLEPADDDPNDQDDAHDN